MRIETTVQLKEFLNGIGHGETASLYTGSKSHQFFGKTELHGSSSFLIGQFTNDDSDWLVVLKQSGEYEYHSLLDRNVDKQNGYNKTYWFTDEDEAKLFVASGNKIKFSRSFGRYIHV